MKINQLIAKFVDTLNNLSLKGIYIPGLIMSSPGAGKTSTLEMYARLKDYNLVSLIASQYSSDDILGIQSVQDGELKKLTPSWFNHLKKLSENGKRTILFIDEITTCDEFIQSPLLNLIFNKSLGEYSLPDNCFIVAAGNYSEELNGAFSVTSPLINRFMILNLSDADYSMNEVLQNTFRDLKSKDYTEFLDLEIAEKPTYDFDKIKDWVGKNLQFTPSITTNNREEGMLGFCSIRSMTYSMDFTREYISNFRDEDWMRIVGDTLGKFRSGDDWLPIRNKLRDNKNRFLIEKVSTNSKRYSFAKLLEDYVTYKSNGSDNKEIISKLEDEISEYMKDPDRLTSSETRLLGSTVENNPNDEFLVKIHKKFLESLRGETDNLNFN